MKYSFDDTLVLYILIEKESPEFIPLFMIDQETQKEYLICFSDKEEALLFLKASLIEDLKVVGVYALEICQLCLEHYLTTGLYLDGEKIEFSQLFQNPPSSKSPVFEVLPTV